MRTIISMIAGMAMTGCAAAQEETDWGDAPDAEFQAELLTPEARGFDFWIGEWRSNWRPRTEDGLDHVETGNQLRQHVFTILGGKALVELAEPFELDPSVAAGRGFSIRYLDGETGNWIMAQHWPSPGWDGVAFMDQLTGPAHHGRMQVYSHDVPQSTPEQAAIRRYTFSDIAADRFRWDGAVTRDDGDSWAVWQVVDFYRQAAHASQTPRGTAWPGHHESLLCTDDAHRAMDGVIGSWTSQFILPDGTIIEGQLDAGPMLEGCGIGAISRIGSTEYFLTWAWSPTLQLWVQMTLSDRPGERHTYAISSIGGEGATFLSAPGATISSPTENYYAGLASAATGARSRQLIEVFTPDAITIRMQRRDSAEAEWVDAGRLELTR
jgi:hypothetical protein